MRPFPHHTKGPESEEIEAHASPSTAPWPRKQKALHTVALNALAPTSPSLIPQASLHLVQGCPITNINANLSQNHSLATDTSTVGLKYPATYLHIFSSVLGLSFTLLHHHIGRTFWEKLIFSSIHVLNQCFRFAVTPQMYTWCQTGSRREWGQLHLYLYFSMSILGPPNYRQAPQRDSLLHWTSSLPLHTKALHAELYFDVA